MHRNILKQGLGDVLSIDSSQMAQNVGTFLIIVYHNVIAT